MRWKIAFLISVAVHCAAIPLAFHYAADAPALGNGKVQLSLELSEERVEKPIVSAPLPVLQPKILPAAKPPPLESKPETIKAEQIVKPVELAAVPAPAIEPLAKTYSDLPAAQEKIEIMETPKKNSTEPSQVVVEAAPRYRENREPIYPSQAQRKKQEGIVTLVVTVNTNGAPMKIEVKHGTGFSLLDEAAVQAVRHWQFEPAKIGKRPIISSVEIPISFKLSK